MELRLSLLGLLLMMVTGAVAAETPKLFLPVERGDACERIAVPKEMACAAAGLAVEVSVRRLAVQAEPKLRAAAVRLLWDLQSVARPDLWARHAEDALVGKPAA